MTLGPEDVFVLVTDQPMSVILPGDHPIAAYIPVEYSEVSITQHASTFVSSVSNPSIREEYPALMDSSIHVGDVITENTSLAYPMMDLVGPQTILLTEDSLAVLMSRGQDKALNGGRSAGRRPVTAIFVSSPFSTRISAMPFGSPVVAGTPTVARKPLRSTFKDPDPIRPLGANEKLVYLPGEIIVPQAIWPRQRGQFDLTITEPLSTADYSQLVESLRRSDTVSAHRIRSNVPQLEYSSMRFRYPSIPPVGGFNVFGLLAQLSLRVKSGRVMIGSSSVPIDAPSVVTFNDIRAFTPRYHVIPIPLVVNGAEQSLDFSLEATSALSINGAPVRLQTDPSRAKIEYFSWIAAILQAIAAVVAVWLVRPAQRRTESVKRGR